MTKSSLVLIVDDDEGLLDTTSTFVEFFGYDVITAKDGVDAVSLYKKHKPGLVLMDVKMPKMDGYSAFFSIEKEFPNAKVIFMTAHSDFSKWSQAKEKNALDLIEKPYSPEQLKALLQKHLPLDT